MARALTKADVARVVGGTVAGAIAGGMSADHVRTEYTRDKIVVVVGTHEVADNSEQAQSERPDDIVL